MLTLFLQGLALGLPAAASPGPFQAYLINQTLSKGFNRAAPVAFAPLLADIPIVLAILLLLDQLPPGFIRVITVLGGVFLIYMAWGLWRQWRGSSAEGLQYGIVDNDEANTANTRNAVLRGVIMNLLSPGPYTFWALVCGPILLSALEQSWMAGVAFLLGFYGALIGGFLGIAGLFHQARRLGPRVVYYLTLASILLLSVFGIVLSVRGIWG